MNWKAGACAFFLLCCPLGSWAQSDDSEYSDVRTDLGSGMLLGEVAERAYDHQDDYFEVYHGHSRDDGHDHGDELPGVHEGEEEALSAYEAVGEIWSRATDLGENLDRDALDVIKVVVAVVDAWTECSDTYEAVKRGVELAPDRAAEIAATIATKKDCNCAAGGIWPAERVEGRIRVLADHPFFEVPRACSCSQAAMYGAISGLPENGEYDATPEDDIEARDYIAEMMVEKTNEIIERTHALQNRGGWDCSCTDVNLAASMRGISSGELRERTWESLGQKYVDEAGDSGLVVDVFGTVGTYPVVAWGSPDINSAANTLRRKPPIYRGDPLLMDPFDPSLEWLPYTDNDITDLRTHQLDTDFEPTDIFMTEYVEGWNQDALNMAEAERDPSERNRVLELFNGSQRRIDLGQDQYVLEIYGPGSAAKPAPPPPPVLVRNTISLESGVTFELDKWAVRPQAADTLKSVVKVLNAADIFSELLIVGHTCDLATDQYNQLLSERRARSVRDFLLQAGLEVDDIRIEGHGELEPVVPNSSEENREQNRRVEITFVTREGMEINRTVSGGGGDRRIEFSWETPGLSPAAVAGETMVLALAGEEFVEGDTSPREVIGLNGAIEPGETLVIAYDRSDDDILDRADIVTGQLDFTPADTLVVRRFGGDRALACHAHSMALLITYPPDVPLLIRPGGSEDDPGCVDPLDCTVDDIEIPASPN